jgi:putative transposase
VCQRYVVARKSTQQAIKKGLSTAKYPYRQKKHYNTKWKRQGYMVYENGKIELSLGLREGKQQKPIILYASNLPTGQIREIECCYDHGPYLAVSFEDGCLEAPYILKSSAGVDLGEIHSIAAFGEQGDAFLITGRKLRAIHRLRHKKLAELRRLQSKCKKGSRQWKKYQKAKRYLLSKSAKQLQDGLHKTTKQFVDWCIQQGISDVYMGDPEGVQSHTRKKKKANRKQAQKLSNWSFGKIKTYLTYKLKRQGMKLHLVWEAYTSQTCAVCKK